MPINCGGAEQDTSENDATNMNIHLATQDFDFIINFSLLTEVPNVSFSSYLLAGWLRRDTDFEPDLQSLQRDPLQKPVRG
jgi:hypothetical protein